MKLFYPIWYNKFFVSKPGVGNFILVLLGIQDLNFFFIYNLVLIVHILLCFDGWSSWWREKKLWEEKGKRRRMISFLVYTRLTARVSPRARLISLQLKKTMLKRYHYILKSGNKSTTQHNKKRTKKNNDC
jgi:hypothetical protein